MMKVGDYDVVRELGRGGMGVVLLGKAPDGTEVAIKLLQNLSKESLLQRFQREERLQALLSAKDGFVPLLASGDAAEGPYLVMPYFKGGTLRDRLQRGMLELEPALVLVHALASALGKAHEAGIVHRDMKPENVLFDEGGKPFVADLGLAKHFRKDLPGGSKSINVTKTGQALGTTGYMAIEQMRDAQHAGPPADVFALGAMLYECLIGRCPPYIGRQKLTALRPDLPEWVAQVIEKALHRDPRERFADGQALARALSHAETRIAIETPVVPRTVSMAALADTETRERFVSEVPGETPEEKAVAAAASAGGGLASAAPVQASAVPVAPVRSAEFVSQVPDAAKAETATKAPAVDRSAPTMLETKPVVPVPTGIQTRIEPPPSAPPSRTWLWVVLLVILGIAVGAIADHLLK